MAMSKGKGASSFNNQLNDDNKSKDCRPGKNSAISIIIVIKMSCLFNHKHIEEKMNNKKMNIDWRVPMGHPGHRPS